MPDAAPSPLTSSLSFADGDELALTDALPRWRLSRLTRRLGLWREKQLIRKALELAGEPTLVLDLSRITGHYWPVLAEHPSRVIIAATDSPAQFETRLQRHAPPQRERIRVLHTAALAIGLPDGAVDCVFCMRPADEDSRRTAFLRELHRVTRDTVILAIGTDRFDPCQRDLTTAGFCLVGRLDFLPLCAARRLAVLRKFKP